MTIRNPENVEPLVGAAPDLETARRIIAGDVREWHEFVDRYSGLIEATLTRRLPVESRDTIHDLYVDVLHDIYKRSLHKYDGRSRLSTWIVMHASARATDYLRAKHGRHRVPRAVAGMGPLEQAVYRYFFVEGLPLGVTMPLVNWRRDDHSLETVIEAIQRVAYAVPPVALRRTNDNARSRGESSESLREIRFFIEARERYRRAARLQEPDVQFARREAERIVTRIESFKESLTDEERRVFELRYDDELPADEVARRLKIPGRRRVYTIADRVVRRLRRMLRSEGMQAEPFPDDR